MSAKPFDDLTDLYEATIDWPKRLANEEPFYRQIFQRIGAGRVLDVACGTGRHGAMFHSWGLAVEGADLSPAMIARCQAQFGQSPRLKWAVRGFDQPVAEPGSFDVAICVGNSLALAPDVATVAACIRQMLAAVRAGGAIIVQVLNLWALPDGPCSWQKCKRAALPAGESLIVKGVHRCGRQGYVDLLVTQLNDAPPALHAECVPFLGIEPDAIEEAACQSGARRIEFFGNYKREPYDREQSQDLIMVAKR